MRARALRPAAGCLVPLGSWRLGGAEEGLLGTGRPSFVKWAGPRQQWPHGFPVPAETNHLSGWASSGGHPHPGPRPQPRCVSGSWGTLALEGPGAPRPSGPRSPQPSPWPCPALSWRRGLKPQPQADEEVARKAEAALMVAEGAGKPTRWGGPGWGLGSLFSSPAPSQQPTSLRAGTSLPGWAPTTRPRQCPASGQPGPQVRGAPMWAGGGVGASRRGPGSPCTPPTPFARKAAPSQLASLTPHTSSPGRPGARQAQRQRCRRGLPPPPALPRCPRHSHGVTLAASCCARPGSSTPLALLGLLRRSRSLSSRRCLSRAASPTTTELTTSLPRPVGPGGRRRRPALGPHHGSGPDC